MMLSPNMLIDMCSVNPGPAVTDGRWVTLAANDLSSGSADPRSYGRPGLLCQNTHWKYWSAHTHV